MGAMGQTAGNLGHYLWDGYRLLQGARVDNVTRVPSWYMEEEVARGLNKDRRH